MEPATSTAYSTDRTPVELRVSARRLIGTIFIVCVLAEIAFFLLDYHVNYARGSEIGAIRRLFNITREDSLSSWFAVTQTWMSALTLWLLLAVVRRQGATRWQAVGWLILALFFTWMAIDDGAKVHERLGTVSEILMEESGDADSLTWGDRLLGFFPSYTWQLVLLPVFAALGLFTLVFLARELTDWFSRFLVAAGLGCFVVAVGLDFVEGLERDHPLNMYRWLIARFDLYEVARFRFGEAAFDVARHFSKSIEETLEMFGNTLLWVVFLRHLAMRTGELRVKLLSPGEPR